jgi:hypothetical protein
MEKTEELRIVIREMISEIYNAPRTGKKKNRWSVKYKKSIDCSHPSGFSQKNYCKRQKSGGNYKK